MTNREVKFWYWLVNMMPTKLVYFSIMHVWAKASTNEYSHLQPDQITWSMAVKTLKVE